MDWGPACCCRAWPTRRRLNIRAEAMKRVFNLQRFGGGVIQAVPQNAPAPVPIESGPKPELPPVDPNGFEARLNDDSRIKLALADEFIDVAGRYGTLRIPCNEILRIEFANRLNPDLKQQIEKALADLGSPEEDVRQQAALQFARWRHAAYPMLAVAAKETQTPAGQQAATLLAKFQESVNEKDFAPLTPT